MKVLIPLLLSLVGALILGALVWSGDAKGQHPDVVELAIANTLAVRTMYGGGGLQVDTLVEVITTDTEDERVHWDGTDLWIHRDGEPAPVKLPAEWATRVRQVWTEWRTGFLQTTFFEEAPTFDAHAPRPEPRKTWYRVVLPFAWADPYLVYVRISTLATPGAIGIYDAATQKPLVIANRREWKHGQYDSYASIARWAYVWHGPFDVPLSPETYSPVKPAELPGSGGWSLKEKSGPHGELNTPAWHELQTFVALERPDSGPRPFVGAQRSHVCETPQSVYETSFSSVFRFPDDPERKALAQQATVDCPNAGFHATLTAGHFPIAGVLRTCAAATWQVVNTLPEPDVVLWQHQINECRTTEGRLQYPSDLSFPPGADPTGIEVRVQAQVRIECQAVSPTPSDAGNVYAAFDQGDQPVLSWPGCYPGWDP